MTTIQLKRRMDTTPPTSLLPGEIGFNLGIGATTMWVGDSTGTPVQYGVDPGGFVKKTGDTMTGALSVPVVNVGTEIRYPGNVVVSGATVRIGGVLAFTTDPAGTTMTGATSGVTREKGDARYLQLTGGTLTGPLILSGAPSAANGAATKGYVDGLLVNYSTTTQANAAYVNTSGDTMTGALALPGTNPTADNHATRKAYVDTQVATKQSAAEADAKYATKVHTHVEADITNLDRLRWRGDWASGNYAQNDVVVQAGTVYVATAAITGTQPPGGSWRILGTQGANVRFGDTAPTSPQPGDLWYRTAPVAGLYVRYNDGNSTQWISTDQASTLAQGFIQKTGDSMSGQLNLMAGNPTANAHAANKAYVDSVAATRLTQAQADALYAPASSDSRLKKFAKDMPDGLDRVLKLRPVTFEWKEHDRPHKVGGTVYGLLAQQVETVLPCSVYKAGESIAIDPLSLIGALVGAVQELARQLEALKK